MILELVGGAVLGGLFVLSFQKLQRDIRKLRAELNRKDPNSDLTQEDLDKMMCTEECQQPCQNPNHGIRFA